MNSIGAGPVRGRAPASAQPAITLRMGTGHLIFFFLVPLVFFRFVPEGAEATRAPGEASRP